MAYTKLVLKMNLQGEGGVLPKEKRVGFPKTN
jgi:hypothetical protein